MCHRDIYIKVEMSFNNKFTTDHYKELPWASQLSVPSSSDTIDSIQIHGHQKTNEVAYPVRGNPRPRQFESTAVKYRVCYQFRRSQSLTTPEAF